MPSDNIEDAGEDAQSVDSSLDVSHSSSSSSAEHQPSGQAEPTTVPDEDAQLARELRNQHKASSIGDWFAIPPPLKRLFDKFPLVTYSENAPPILGSPSGENTLYIFTTHDAVQGRASFNPSCLKWQTCLRMAGIPFRTVPSNNHASPNGSLPFLSIVPVQAKMSVESGHLLPVPELIQGTRLKRWIQEQRGQSTISAPDDVMYDAYASLLENAIRKAWLYQLYLNPWNAFAMNRLYTEPCSSNPLVQITIASQLRAAATSEIVKASPQSSQWTRIDEARLMRDADDAFLALSTLLADCKWFFANSTESSSGEDRRGGPSLFDASVFAYTHLILDSERSSSGTPIKWESNPLGALLEKHHNLVQHRGRIVDMYY